MIIDTRPPKDIKIIGFETSNRLCKAIGTISHDIASVEIEKVKKRGGTGHSVTMVPKC